MCERKCPNQLDQILNGLYLASPCVNRASNCPENSQQASRHVETFLSHDWCETQRIQTSVGEKEGSFTRLDINSKTVIITDKSIASSAIFDML